MKYILLIFISCSKNIKQDLDKPTIKADTLYNSNPVIIDNKYCPESKTPIKCTFVGHGSYTTNKYTYTKVYGYNNYCILDSNYYNSLNLWFKCCID